MAGSVNKVIIVGNLGKDPEIRALGSGDRVANLSIATSETWRDKGSGERKEKTEWHKVVVFNENIVKVCEQYLKKGSTVYVEGALQTRKWTDQQGAEKYSTEIVLQKFRGELTMLGGRNQGGESGDSYGGGSSDTAAGEAAASSPAARRKVRVRAKASPPTSTTTFRSRMSAVVRTAACRCGALTAVCEGEPVRVSVCHCYACQRRSGSAFAAQVRFDAEKVTVSGEARQYDQAGDSGGMARFDFCPTCGTTIAYRAESQPDVVAIPLGAFADNSAFPPPEYSVYEARRHRWVAILGEGIEHHD